MAESSRKPMAAPPSTAYRIVDVPQPYGAVIERYGVQGKFASSDEKKSPWVPFVSNAAIRHLTFDVRRNAYSNMLWIKSGGVVGTHRHRGTVVMVCREATAPYRKYDGVAGPAN